MKPTIAATAFGFALIMLSQVADAASITVDRWGRATLSGPIENGDDVRLRDLVAEQSRRGQAVTDMYLDSPGGAVATALRMADIVAAHSVSTIIARGKTCASACAVIFYAGFYKTLQEGGRLGVHRAVEAGGYETKVSWEASMLTAYRMTAAGAPAAVVDKLLATPPSGITWLDGHDDYHLYDPMVYCGVQTCFFPGVKSTPHHYYRVYQDGREMRCSYWQENYEQRGKCSYVNSSGNVEKSID
jgi:hypothetical protein